MQDVASDNGIGPVNGGHGSTAGGAGATGDVGGLIAAVESKMAELMAWHAQQVKQLETDKTVLRTQAEEQARSMQSERDEIAWLRGELDADKAKLAEQREGLTRWRDTLQAEQEELGRRREALDDKAGALDRAYGQLDEQRAALREKFEGLLQSSIDQLGEPMRLSVNPCDHPEEQAADRHAA